MAGGSKEQQSGQCSCSHWRRGKRIQGLSPQTSHHKLRSPGLCLQEMGTQRALNRGSGRSDERVTQEPVLRAGTKDEEDHEEASQKMLCNFKMPQLRLLW